MTDPYEYLFSKLQLKLEELPNYEGLITPKFGLYSDSKYICSFRYYQTAKTVFLYLTDQKNSFSRWGTKIKPIVKLLRQFPAELESKEHVDLLLTLNGLNKGA